MHVCEKREISLPSYLFLDTGCFKILATMSGRNVFYTYLSVAHTCHLGLDTLVSGFELVYRMRKSNARA